MELLNSLFPISSRTLVQRLRDMEHDRLIDRTDFGGNPPHIEYALTERGMLLLPLLESLRQLGLTLKCNECEDRLNRVGAYCEPCPNNESGAELPSTRRSKDESIVLL
jgi:DNA-binding HxlR family transcriptional regulator